MTTAFNKINFAWIEVDDPTPGIATAIFNSVNIGNYVTPELTPSTTANLLGLYDIDVNIDNSGYTTYTIDAAGTETISDIAALLNAAIPTAVVESVDNTITITSNTTGVSSSVIIAETTSGQNLNLLSTLSVNNNYTYLLDMVAGNELILADPSNWILNPVFDDPVRAFQVGPFNWTWVDEPNIHVMTDEEIATDPATLAAIRGDLWRLIQVERDRRTQAGVKVGSFWFHSDQSSRIQQLGLVIMGSNLPTGIMWKTMAGSFVEMTPALAGQIFQAVAATDIAIFTVAEQHKAQMFASATPLTYNYLTGTPPWPQVFGE
jgi:hypothetical protein